MTPLPRDAILRLHDEHNLPTVSIAATLNLNYRAVFELLRKENRSPISIRRQKGTAPIAPGVGKRKCLRCRKVFHQEFRGNFICRPCTASNRNTGGGLDE